MPLDFTFVYDKQSNDAWIETSITGKSLLTTPQLNKSTAFTHEERHSFGLIGKLPPVVETLEQQTLRAYNQLNTFESELQRHVYLNSLHDTNQVLFYKLVTDHIEELMPLIYTPYVGDVVKTFSQQFRRPRGLYLSYQDRNDIDEIFNNRTNPNIDLIVVTDGEAVLGIGDQGIGAINIPIAKLMVYTLSAGINPLHTLPIILDVGTDNQTLLNDPFYLGLRQPRLRGEEYNKFIEYFIATVAKYFPKAFLHWEDFSARTSHHNLKLCEGKICSFNDDVQGTGGAAFATILAALKHLQLDLGDTRIVIFGAGSAGMGITCQIYSAMKKLGLSEEEARKHFWLIDQYGLLTNEMSTLTDSQRPFARDVQECIGWKRDQNGAISLHETVAHVKPTILIGCSSVANSFSENTIRLMAANTPHPIIMPLSNPTVNAEATPVNIINWTDGRALVATGSPFPDVNYNGRTIPIAQCNNSKIFPGIGLGVIAIKAREFTEGMMFAASEALSQCSPILSDPKASLLPGMADARVVARKIAIAVATEAVKEGLAQKEVQDIAQAVDCEMWQPRYYPMKKKV
jgi:malate dehydrogenase (oxaloacetate-decarboxylating)